MTTSCFLSLSLVLFAWLVATAGTVFGASVRERREAEKSVEVVRGKSVTIESNVVIIFRVLDRFVVPDQAGAQNVVRNPVIDAPDGLSVSNISLNAEISDVEFGFNMVGKGYVIRCKATIAAREDMTPGEYTASIQLPHTNTTGSDAKTEMAKFNFKVRVWKSEDARSTAHRMERQQQADQVEGKKAKEFEMHVWAWAVYLGWVVGVPLVFLSGYRVYQRHKVATTKLYLTSRDTLPDMCIRCGGDAEVVASPTFRVWGNYNSSSPIPIPFCRRHKRLFYLQKPFYAIFAAVMIAGSVGAPMLLLLSGALGGGFIAFLAVLAVPLGMIFGIGWILRSSVLHAASFGGGYDSFNICLVGVSVDVVKEFEKMEHSASVELDQ